MRAGRQEQHIAVAADRIAAAVDIDKDDIRGQHMQGQAAVSVAWGVVSKLGAEREGYIPIEES